MNSTLRARLQLAALFVLRPLPDQLAKPLYLFLDPLIGPPRDDDDEAIRRAVGGALGRGFDSRRQD